MSVAEVSRNAVAVVLIAVAIVVGVLMLWALRDMWLLVFGAVLIAVGVRGAADAIRDRTKLNEGLSLAIVALAILAILVGLVALLGAQISAQIGQIVARAPEGWERLQNWIATLPLGPQMVSELQSGLSGQGAGSLLTQFGSRATSMAATIGGAMLDLFLVLVAAAFFATDPRTYREGLLKLMPRDRHAEIRQAMNESSAALRKWLLGALFSMSVMVALVTTGLLLIGVPAALALGVLTGLAQFVPLIGPIIAAVPGILLALTVSPETALWAALIYFGASQLEANLLTPLIQKRAVSLPPALTLFAVIAGGLLFGPLGIVLATPLIVVAMVFVVRFWVRQTLNQHAETPGGGPAKG